MVFWGSAPTKKRFGSWDRKHNIGRCYGDRLRSLNFNDWISLWFGCLCGESLSSPESQQNYSMSLTWNEHRDYFLVTCHYDMLWSGTRPAESGSGVRGAGGGVFPIGRWALNGVMGSVTDGADGVPQPLLRPSPSPPVTILSRLRPLWCSNHTAAPPPAPRPQNKTLIGGIMGYRSEGLTALSHLEQSGKNCWEAFNNSLNSSSSISDFLTGTCRTSSYHKEIPFHYWPCDNNLSKQHWRNSSVLARPSV